MNKFISLYYFDKKKNKIDRYINVDHIMYVKPDPCDSNSTLVVSVHRHTFQADEPINSVMLKIKQIGDKND